MTNQSQNESRKEYFDLHTQGIGYINRIREVTPEEGSPFLVVTIAALRGRVDNAQYTHFECRVPDSINRLVELMRSDPQGSGDWQEDRWWLQSMPSRNDTSNDFSQMLLLSGPDQHLDTPIRLPHDDDPETGE